MKKRRATQRKRTAQRKRTDRVHQIVDSLRANPLSDFDLDCFEEAIRTEIVKRELDNFTRAHAAQKATN